MSNEKKLTAEETLKGHYESKKRSDILRKHLGDKVYYSTGEIHNSIEDAMSEYASTRSTEGWVSVEDVKPEVNKAVRVWQANKYGIYRYAIGNLREDGKWNIFFDDDEKAVSFISEYVTHWQPLPSPPIK